MSRAKKGKNDHKIHISRDMPIPLLRRPYFIKDMAFFYYPKSVRVSAEILQKVNRPVNQIYIALVTGGKLTPIGGRQYTAWVLAQIILLTFS